MVLYVCKQAFHISAYISKSKRCNNNEPSVNSFCVKTKISVDFSIWIKVTLKLLNYVLIVNYIKTCLFKDWPDYKILFFIVLFFTFNESIERDMILKYSWLLMISGMFYYSVICAHGRNLVAVPPVVIRKFINLKVKQNMHAFCLTLDWHYLFLNKPKWICFTLKDYQSEATKMKTFQRTVVKKVFLTIWQFLTFW